MLTRPPFERAGKAPGRQTPIYALRLGNHRYPHMKLQIQPWPNEAGFMLSVNTHDQVAGVNLSEVDAQAFRDLQAENQRLKEPIEQAWDDAGLPTFLRYLRDYIESRRGLVRSAGRPRVRTDPILAYGRPRSSTVRDRGVSVVNPRPPGSRQEEREGRALPGLLETSTRPPCSSTNVLTSQRPRPMPRLPNW